jgi:hypothetical protein
VWDALLEVFVVYSLCVILRSYRCEKKPKAKRWRKTPFPLYNDILYPVEGIVATGAGAFHAGSASQTQSTDTSTQLTQSASQKEPATQENIPAPPTRNSPSPVGLNLPRGVRYHILHHH